MKCKLTCAHTGWCVEGEKILEICQRGDKLLEEEVAKVYKGKKISKGSTRRDVTPTVSADAMIRDISSHHCLPKLLCHTVYSTFHGC